MRKIIGSCNHVAQLDLREFKGRVFFVSDVHGYYDLLYRALSDVAFKSDTDILISGGDWTDRGPHSEYVLDWLHEPWVHSVRGNHEELFIDGYDSQWDQNNSSVRCLKNHGGRWIWSLTDLQQTAIYESFKSLPLGIELLMPRGRKIAVVHAEVPYNDWDMFKDVSPTEYDMYAMAEAQWARRWYSSQYHGQVKGVDFVLVGHTPTDSGDVEKLGNMVFTDGGSFFRDKINLIELNDQFMRNVK